MAPVKLAMARWARSGSRPASQAITASTANSGRVCSQARIARARPWEMRNCAASAPQATRNAVPHLDRKSTRLNSSHSQISYAVFCLKKNKAKPESEVVEPIEEPIEKDEDEDKEEPKSGRDFTKYTLSFAGQKFEKLSKGRLAHSIVK